jgi:riboflavin kinase/FMN adenylyltransferase
VQPEFQQDEKTASSSLIRELLRAGDVSRAGVFLQRPFSLNGVVIKGEGRGRQIGFPTANVKVPDDLLVPANGVYATRTSYRGMMYKSVTNVGHNPTFKDTQQLHVETHLLDFETDIYGENLSIDFISRIRDERKFPTVNDLVEQIRRDVTSARSFLG